MVQVRVNEWCVAVHRGHISFSNAELLVDHEQNTSDQNAQAAGYDVGDAEERIFAAQPGGVRQNEKLLATELGDGKICVAGRD